MSKRQKVFPLFKDIGLFYYILLTWNIWNKHPYVLIDPSMLNGEDVSKIHCRISLNIQVSHAYFKDKTKFEEGNTQYDLSAH